MSTTIKDTRAVRETQKAILVVVGHDEHWIAKSQIDDDSEVWRAGHSGDLVISDWLAEQIGL